MLVALLCLTLSDPMDLQPARLLCPWNSPGKNTGASSHSLLQKILLSQGLNPGLPHCRQVLYHLSHQGSHINIYIYIHTHTHIYTYIYIYIHTHNASLCCTLETNTTLYIILQLKKRIDIEKKLASLYI